MKNAAEKVETLVIAFEAKGLKPFARLEGGPPARFRKEVLRVGRWVHPVTGQILDFDRAFLERLAANTNRWIALGHEVWFPAGHNADPLKNLGRWPRFLLEGERLVGEVLVADETAAERIGKTITGVSADIRFDQPASVGEVFDAVIVHVAATPCPVIPAQQNFVRLAQEVPEGETSDAGVSEPAKDEKTTSSVVTPERVLLAIKQILGLPDEADQGSIVEAVRALAALEERNSVSQGQTGAIPAPLAREIEALKKRDQEREAELQKIRRKAAEREVALATDAMRGSLPIDKETAELALECLMGSEKEEARGRKILELAVDRARLAGRTQGSGSRAAPAPEKTSEKKAQTESDRVLREVLLSQGWTIETDAEGLITKKISPAERARVEGRR